MKPISRAACLAALITASALCAGGAIARVFPFGPRTRSVNDLGNQYVPYHAYLWDLLHGRADGDLFVNWRSGFGSSLLPDLGTYLTSPFAPLVALFPRDEIDLAVYVITVVKLAAAGAAMAWLLLRLRPGRWWVAGALGGSYALCGWAVADGAHNPMWLDGLIAFPLLCLVGEWATAGRRPVLGALVVAVVWIANFYTAYMATLGAGLLLLARLLAGSHTVRERLVALRRAALTTMLGMGLAAPVVVVVYFGTRHAYPGRNTVFSAVPWTDVLARLLPTTYSFGTPGIYVNTAALLLALTLPFNPAVPRRARLVLTGLVAGVVLPFQWGPTHLVWNAFSTPNGSSYRQAFVLCGLLVIAAWWSFAHGVPGPRPVLAASGLLALVAAGASFSPLVYVWSVPIALVGAASGVVVLTVMAAGRPRRRVVACCAALLITVQLGQSAGTAALSDRLRLAHSDDYAPWGARQSDQRDALARADDWPRYRTEPGREQTVGNDPLLVGGQGAQYYSSLTSDVLSRTLTALGGGWTSRGRSVQSLDNQVTDVLFSVGARVRSPPDPYQRWNPPEGGVPVVTRREVPPLVTVRPAGAVPEFGASPFRNQEKLLGARVYTVPRIRPVRVRPLTVRPLAANPVVTARITASCPAGSEAQLWAPHYSGTARLTDAASAPASATGPAPASAPASATGPAPLFAPASAPDSAPASASGLATGPAPASATASGAGSRTPVARFRADYPVTKIASMQPLGTVPPSGRVTVELTPEDGGIIPDGALGCLDTGRLSEAVHRLQATGATEVRVSGHTVTAELPPGARRTAVLAVPRIAGWRCSAGSAAPRPAGSYLGLVSVPLAGSTAPTTVRCDFRPPGLRVGALVGGASLLIVLVLLAHSGLRARSSRRKTRQGAPC
ncbi:YfhO family protein [Streptomyces sp. NPDC059922]|uniref:YfhO family protein n=1 Tax=Streptomyces sp. NPDC059922 TaxID=3347005 RepID=UPI0036615FC0